MLPCLSSNSPVHFQQSLVLCTLFLCPVRHAWMTCRSHGRRSGMSHCASTSAACPLPLTRSSRPNRTHAPWNDTGTWPRHKRSLTESTADWAAQPRVTTTPLLAKCRICFGMRPARFGASLGISAALPPCLTTHLRYIVANRGGGPLSSCKNLGAIWQMRVLCFFLIVLLRLVRRIGQICPA